MSIIDIARSGILAYRNALAVTSENVANVNTEGYVRRDVVMEPLGGARMTPISGGTLGQGVWVQDVRRAFDSIAADRLRSSDSAVAAASVQVNAGLAMEDVFLPGSAGIGSALDDFFGNLGKLAAQPADLGLRRVVMQHGASVAASFADAAKALHNARDGLMAQAGQAVVKVSSVLQSLAEVNQKMVGLGSTPGAVNPLQDQRDRLLTELAAEVEVNVTLDQIGRAEVFLGPGPGGHRLLDGKGAAALTLAQDTPLAVSLRKGDSTASSTLLTGGALGGFASALSATDATISEMNQLARRFVSDINTAHAAGVDLDTRSGAPLFELRGIKAEAAVINRGTTAISLTGTTLAAPVTVVYDGPAAVWRAVDGTGAELASGTSRLDLPGLSVNLQGRAVDGDRFTLTPRSGDAQDMAFVLTNPRSFAAASSSVVSSLATNRGTGSINIEPASLPATGLSSLGGQLMAGAADAVTLIQPGVVGGIPAGSGSADLYAMGRQASLDWMATDAALASGGRIAFSVAGQAHRFDFPAGLTASGLADALNRGDLVSATGESLTSLGLRAGGVSGQFSLALGQGNFGVGATLTVAAGPMAAIVTASEPQAGALQVFTRDGRQISGTPLSAAEATALLTPANGFLPGAVYRTDYLNAATGAGYRGTGVDREVVPGAQAVTLALPAVASFGVPRPATPLSVTYAGQTHNLTLPEGANAQRAAAAIGAQVKGLEVSASTALSLGGLADGQVSFALGGDNLGGVPISASIAGGDLGALARAISLAAGATGISASLSPEGDRILLTHPSGADIRVSGFSHSSGGTMAVTATDAAGQARAAGVVLGAGTAAAQVSGQLSFAGGAGFGVLLNGVFTNSAPDAFAGGMVVREVAAGGAQQVLGFTADMAADAGAVAGDGLSSFAASLTYGLTVHGQTVTLTGASSPQAVAAGLVAALRDASPVAGLTGAALTNLPAEGSATAVSLDGGTYILRMQAGQVVVDGPEPGRLTAGFDGANRLQLSVVGGSPDGMGVRPLPGATGAAGFGIGAGQAATLRLTGLPVVPADLPSGGQVLRVDLAGVPHDLTVRRNGGSIAVDLPPGFGGTATVLADGRVSLEVAAGLGPMRVAPGAALAGFGQIGAAAVVDDGRLRLTSADGMAMDVRVDVAATVTERLHLTNLPNEDLIVAMTGPGALRLAGTVTPAPTTPPVRAAEVRVTDAARGLVELFDTETGHSISSGVLDAQGQATLGGYRITMTGTPVTGDGFALTPNATPTGDSRALQRMIALADAASESGRGGFARILAEMSSDIGAATSANQRKQTTLTSANDALRRKVAEAGAVDLDAEAARLIELQQAYQASSQVMTIARQMFDTILNSM